MYSRRIALHCTTALDCMVLSYMTPQLWVNVRPVRTRWVSHLSVGTLTFGPWSEFILGGKARLGWDGMGWMDDGGVGLAALVLSLLALDLPV